MKTLALNPQQQRAAEILSRLAAGAPDVTTAAGLLEVGEGQVRHLRAAALGFADYDTRIDQRSVA